MFIAPILAVVFAIAKEVVSVDHGSGKNWSITFEK